MKGIKFFFGALAAAGLLISVSATAQENANRDADGNVVRGPYETNGTWDNTFIGAALGLNSTFNFDNKGAVPFATYPGIALDVYAGKWFTPTVGARVGWYGLNTHMFTGNNADIAWQNVIAADFLWNASSTFGGYKETRSWSWIPYARAGLEFYNKNPEWVLGAGLLVQKYINDRWNFMIDLRSLVAKNAETEQYAVNNGIGRFNFPASLTFGAQYKFGKTGFDRHSSITPVIIPVPFTEDEYNQLSEQVAALQKENEALQQKVKDLEEENAKYHNFVEGQTYVYQNGEFVACDANQGAPATLYFDCGKSTLSDRELAHLEFFASSILNEDSEIVVTGSADKQTGTASFNKKLSEKRANYVKDILIKKYGLKDENIEVVADGDTNNVFDTPAKNRCVTIRIK